jgi:lysophospholipase L1-like esterase
MLGRELSRHYEDVRVINEGVSGDTAEDGVARLRESVLEKEPDLVLVSFGLNDMKNGRAVGAYAADMERIVEEIYGYGATAVLMTTTRLLKGTGMVARVSPEPFNEALRNIASRKAVFLIDVYKEFEGYNTARYLMDVAHPNGEGYRVLAGIIREGLVGE